MKKIMQWVLAAILFCGASVFTSCSDNTDNPVTPDLNLAEKIVGKWETDQLYGQPALTNNKVVLTFESGTKAFMSAAINSSPDVVILWMNREEVGCTIEGNIVTLVEQIGENMSGVVTLQVTSINDNELVGQISQKIFSGELQIVTIPEHPVHYKKVSVDYNSQVVGLWECVEMTGEETYNDANARLDFKADGTYDYYQKVNDEWTQVPNREVNEYNVDGEWFATRWKSTDSPMLYEWWDIVSIEDGVMVWNGLRQKTDGERFTTTYRWKKVEN